MECNRTMFLWTKYVFFHILFMERTHKLLYKFSMFSPSIPLYFYIYTIYRTIYIYTSIPYMTGYFDTYMWQSGNTVWCNTSIQLPYRYIGTSVYRYIGISYIISNSLGNSIQESLTFCAKRGGYAELQQWWLHYFFLLRPAMFVLCHLLSWGFRTLLKETYRLFQQLNREF